MPADPFFEKHKPIRNKIRTYDTGVMLSLSLKTLFQSEDDFAKGSGYVPWELMLLIRWTLQYKTPQATPKVPVMQDMNVLLNQIKELYAHDRLLPEGGPHALHKFMRRTAFQQFSYQIKEYHLTQKIGRQLMLFEDLGKGFKIPEKFKELTGLSIQEFLMISLGIYTQAIMQKKQLLLPKTFSVFFDAKDVQKFFDCTSLTVEAAQKYLVRDAASKGGRFMLQLYEVSPLARYPFLKVADQYACYSKRLFYYFFSNFIDDFLADNVKDWSRDFGNILEKYIKERLDYASVPYIPDGAWKKRLPHQPQVPDFTLPFDAATVFIEAKSKGLKIIPRIYQTNDALSKHLDDSVVKGIVQIYSLAHALRQKPFDDIKNTDNFYGIVVYYKDYYLKGGRGFWEEFLKDVVEAELKTLCIDAGLIPPENLFLLSIDEFDYLVMFMKRYPAVPLTGILDRAKEFAADPRTSSLFFEDYLKRIAPDNTLVVPEYLRLRFRAVPDTILSRAEEKTPEILEKAKFRHATQE